MRTPHSRSRLRHQGPVLLAFVAALTGTSPALADELVYPFSWTSIGEFSNTIFVGGSTPFEIVRGSNTISGTGDLVLTATGPNAFSFQFAGIGGSGFGQIVNGAIIPDIESGNLGLPIPPGTQALSTPESVAGGFAEFTGDPNRPSSVTLSYTEGFRCNTFCNTWFLEFSGTTRVQAAEPAMSLVFVAAAFIALAVVHRRRRRATPDA